MKLKKVHHSEQNVRAAHATVDITDFRYRCIAAIILQ